jgi:uncharacterized cupin superfamily protein
MGVSHQLYNHTDNPFLFFALSSTHSNEVCEYPDSRKKLEVKSRRITQDGFSVDDYWRDEELPDRNWNKQYLKGR